MSGEANEIEVELSLILPIYQEEESIPHLIKELHQALQKLNRSYEIICVDDGSTDQSFYLLAALAKDDPTLVVVQFRRNFGQTAAMQAGLDLARGKLVAFMDADMQNDPADLDMMIQTLEAEDADMVVGWRFNRQDTFVNRKLPSIIANYLIAKVTGVKIHDNGCSLKLLHRDLAKSLKLYGDMHRFIPAMASVAGARIKEVKVNHRARQFGQSKYGISRTIKVILDLLVIYFILSYQVKPMRIFGLSGLLSGFLGLMICSYLTLAKLFYGISLSDRPLLLLGILLIMIGVQLISMGFLGDMLTRTYHESQGKPPYYIRRKIDHKSEVKKD
jgi:glycosyltransferase involved in cell wall biosynthesis